MEGFWQCISNKDKFGYRPIYRTWLECEFQGERRVNKENCEHYTRYFKLKKGWSRHYEMKEEACNGQGEESYSTGKQKPKLWKEKIVSRKDKRPEENKGESKFQRNSELGQTEDETALITF